MRLAHTNHFLDDSWKMKIYSWLGSVLKACIFLKDSHPEFNIPEETLRNVIAHIRVNEHSSSDPVKELTKMTDKSNTIQYLKCDLNDHTGSLRSIIWICKGASDVMDTRIASK